MFLRQIAILKSITILFIWLVFSDFGSAQNRNSVGNFIIGQELVTSTEKQCDEVTKEFSLRESDFRKSVCLWHLNRNTNNIGAIDNNIRMFQNLQTLGLPSSQEALAVLLEGLSHCQKARSLIDTASREIVAKAMFCRARNDAKNSIASIPWRFARFAYADGVQGASTSQLIQNISLCHSENQPLDSAFDSFCGIYQGINEEVQQALVEEEYIKIEAREVTSGQLTDLFVEKLEIASSIKSTATQRSEKLSQEATQVDIAYSDAKGVVDPVFTDLEIAKGNYDNAFSTSKAILTRYKDWEEGLLLEKTNDGQSTDFSIKLVGVTPDSIDSKSQLGLINSATKEISGPMGLMDLLIKAELKQKAKVSEGEKQLAMYRKVCAVYYCHLSLNADPQFDYFAGACRTPELVNKKNPLCAAQDQKLKIGSKEMTFANFCSEVGFPDKFIGKRLSLVENETAECSANLK